MVHETQKTVLIVDDCEGAIEVMASRVNEHGYRVVTARNFAEADDILREQQVDLAIIAMMLLGDEGFKTIKAVKHRAGSLVPEVMLAGWHEEFHWVKAKVLGADAESIMPYDDLIDLLMRLCPSASHSPSLN